MCILIHRYSFGNYLLFSSQGNESNNDEDENEDGGEATMRQNQVCP